MRYKSFLAILFAKPGQCHTSSFYVRRYVAVRYLLTPLWALYAMVCYYDRSSYGNFLRFHSLQLHNNHSKRLLPNQYNSATCVTRATVLMQLKAAHWTHGAYTHLPRTSLFYFLWPGLAILCSLKVGKSSLDKNGATASYSNTDFKVKLLLLLWMLFDTQITLPVLPRRTILRWKWPSMLGLVLLLADGLYQQQKKHQKKGPRTQSF